MKKSVGVIGAGAWGTAIAHVIALSDNEPLIWAKERSVYKDIKRNKVNSQYLDGIKLSANIQPTTKISEIFEECTTVFIACPAKYYTEIISLVSNLITDEHQLIICSKGFRKSDGALLSDVLDEIITTNPKIGVLAGPAFAIELASKKPCMMTISSSSSNLIKNVNEILSLKSLRLYHNSDIIGAQIGAAIKNVISIAAGISHEMQLGESIQAAIICRGLKEIERYSDAFGGKKETIYGLAGLGDIILTSNSSRSRNYCFGRNIGKGLTAKEALELEDGYIEGLATARIVTMKALSQGIDLAIISAIDGILYGDVSAEKVVNILLQRPRTHEWD